VLERSGFSSRAATPPVIEPDESGCCALRQACSISQFGGPT
jgi:hypothetical protein